MQVEVKAIKVRDLRPGMLFTTESSPEEQAEFQLNIKCFECDQEGCPVRLQSLRVYVKGTQPIPQNIADDIILQVIIHHDPEDDSPLPVAVYDPLERCTRSRTDRGGGIRILDMGTGDDMPDWLKEILRRAT